MKSDIFLSFAAGFIAGTAVAYLLITDRLQRKMDQEIEERVDEVEKSAFEEYRENIEYITKMHEKKEEKNPRDICFWSLKKKNQKNIARLVSGSGPNVENRWISGDLSYWMEEE